MKYLITLLLLSNFALSEGRLVKLNRKTYSYCGTFTVRYPWRTCRAPICWKTKKKNELPEIFKGTFCGTYTRCVRANGDRYYCRYYDR